MSFAEKLLRCVDCGKTFTFTSEEQFVHASHGFINSPNRCPPCRRTKKGATTKSENASEDFSSHRQMFPVTCSQCGKATRVPFQPRQDKTVLCGDCYVRTRVGK
jgi:CxxC-x17-CxxC domain-containing protein